MRGQKFPIAGLLFFLSSLACSGGDKKDEAPKVAPKPAVAPATPPPSEPPTPGSDVSFEATDKTPLSGKLHLAKDPAAPLLVFVHRFRGDRGEWGSTVERLAKSEKRYSILNFDLRGHGASKSTELTRPASTTKKKAVALDWASMDAKDMPSLVHDVRGAIQFGVDQAQGKTRGVVLVGSSLGAALAAKAAGEDARVMALAVVSPGAAINGFDVYHPFANVRQLPSFIASAKEDNVSKEPAPALARMAGPSGTVRLYDGGGHAAFGLLRESARLNDDLERWLMQVFDGAPVQREVVPPEGAAPKRKKAGR